MEHYRTVMRGIEKERANFLSKIDLVQPSFEEQHQLEVLSVLTQQRMLYTMHATRNIERNHHFSFP